MYKNILLRDCKVGYVVKFARHGTKWTVEERVEPGRTFNGYITFRTPKGTFKCIGSRDWDLPVRRMRHERF